MLWTRSVLALAGAVCCLEAPSPGRVSAQDRLTIENPQGFHTARNSRVEHFRALWESLQDDRKMKGVVTDHLAAEKLDSVVMLEVNISIPHGPGLPGVQGELFHHLAKGNRFTTGPLPGRFGKDADQKYLVALVRTKKGEYGLITRYRDVTVIELNGMIGVVPDPMAAGGGPAAPARGSGKR